MPADIRNFFDGYREAFNRLDGLAVTEHYEVPAMIAHGGGKGIFMDVETLRANNVALCAQYESDGFLRADYEERTFIPQGNDFCVADLAWKISGAGHPPRCFNTSYALRRSEGAWKVFCVTAYEERRPWTENE